ncbi:hypothetical protein BV25DRAFT_1833447 [Artomyces pyxidatus]|uniref:Uncharacterized protein n=1 Tax=Artomyces pyxidatus TaxID=48021 RepID=A0ACB8SF43_9AGAM|nr:hypothetical protein BV25DRAFT_1833447 [Artomyces pyxidatus]
MPPRPHFEHDDQPPQGVEPGVAQIWSEMDDNMRAIYLRKLHTSRYGPGAPMGEPFGQMDEGGNLPDGGREEPRHLARDNRGGDRRGGEIHEGEEQRRRRLHGASGNQQRRQRRHDTSPYVRTPAGSPDHRSHNRRGLNPSAIDPTLLQQNINNYRGGQDRMAATSGRTQHDGDDGDNEEDEEERDLRRERGVENRGIRRWGSGRHMAAKEKRKMIRHGSGDAKTSSERLAAAGGPALVNIAKSDSKMLTANQRRARRDILNLTAAAIRQLTDISRKDKWPVWVAGMPQRLNPTTNQPYYTPNFDARVDDAVNRELLKRVADVVWDDMKLDEDGTYTWAKDPTFKVDRQTILMLAQVSFQGFRKQFNSGKTEELTRKALFQSQASRRSLRRQAKAKALLSAIDQYLKKYDEPNPIHFVTPEMMSDEASCAEGYVPEDLEETLVWKAAMAQELGILAPSREVLERLKIFERIEPKWRSAEMSVIFTRLRKIHWASLSSKEKKEYAYRVRLTDRSSDIPPLVAPYDAGINRDWYEFNKEDLHHHLGDWYTYGNPVGWESSDHGQVGQGQRQARDRENEEGQEESE